MRRLWPAHDPFPALARRQPTARPILCLFAARRLPINRAGRRRAGPKSRASRAVRVPRRCLWTWQDDPAARAMRGASGRAWSLLHGLACCPPAASPSQSSCLPSIISPSSHGHSQCPSDWPPAGGSFPDRALGHLGVSNSRPLALPPTSSGGGLGGGLPSRDCPSPPSVPSDTVSEPSYSWTTSGDRP